MVDQSGNCNFAVAMKDKKSNNGVHLFEGWAFGKINYFIFSIGIGLLLAGYTLMANGSVNSFQSISLSPILLFLGYIVVIPLALVYRENK